VKNLEKRAHAGSNVLPISPKTENLAFANITDRPENQQIIS
jgi:hypothetical protein